MFFISLVKLFHYYKVWNDYIYVLLLVITMVIFIANQYNFDMLKLIGLMIILIIIAIGVDYVITTSLSEDTRITVSEKYTDGDLYIIKTLSVQQFGTNRDIYYKLEIGKTYDVKIFMGNIREAKNF